MLKKKPELNALIYINLIIKITFVIGIILALMGAYYIDSGYNLKYVNSISDLNLSDSNYLGDVITADNLYRTGYMYEFMGIFFLILSWILQNFLMSVYRDSY